MVDRWGSGIPRLYGSPELAEEFQHHLSTSGTLVIVKELTSGHDTAHKPDVYKRQPLAILEKYREHPVCIKKGCCLPVLCNQKMNSYLKAVSYTHLVSNY